MFSVLAPTRDDVSPRSSTDRTTPLSVLRMRSGADRRRQFERFAEAEGLGLFKLAFNLCGDRERAEDAVQDALVEVYRRWASLREPLAYARRAAVNATRDDWHRSSRQHRVSEALMELPAPTAVVPQDFVPERDALMAALDALPERERAVVVLRYGSQLSEVETAAVLEIPLGTVKTHCRRALANLRETLAEPTTDSCHEAER